MLEIIKTLILDFMDSTLETGVPRRVYIKSVPGKATVCVGVRRCGKSTYMSQIMQSLLDQGVSRENILCLNFFDDRLHNLQHEGLALILQAYFSLYPNKKNTEKIYCFFDEIQVIPGWEAFVERLQRTENCEIYITGSSAHLLSKEIATQMRGRALSWEMFPFSFLEYLDYKGIDATLPLSTKKQFLVQNAFVGYWETGGFPEVVGLSQDLRIKIHQEYLQAILFRDLVERHDISHPKALLDLAHKLIDTPASLYSINSLTGYLQSLGHKAPKSSVSAYVEWFEDTYFLFTLRVFDASLSRSQAAPKKIYCIDHALVRSISSGILVNSRLLLENLVFVSLRRAFPLVYYYKTKSGREVDFIVQHGSQKTLIQVCESIANEATKKREVAALTEAMTELGLSSGIIVTRNEEGQINMNNQEINIVPVWRFLLERSF
ncbi:MAG: ATP-binding protein [Alphaproteobacteria bacterium]